MGGFRKQIIEHKGSHRVVLVLTHWERARVAYELPMHEVYLELPLRLRAQ